MFKILCPAASLVLLVSALCQSADAGEIWILNCEGKPLLARAVEAHQKKDLCLRISKVEDGPAVLHAQKGGNTIRGTITSGTVTFPGVEEGAWKLCMSDGTPLDGVSLVEDINTGSGISIAEAVLGSAAAGVAAVGFVAGTSGSDGRGGTAAELAGTGEIPAQQQGGVPAAGARVSSPRGECFVGEKVVPLSPFM